MPSKKLTDYINDVEPIVDTDDEASELENVVDEIEYNDVSLQFEQLGKLLEFYLKLEPIPAEDTKDLRQEIILKMIQIVKSV